MSILQIDSAIGGLYDRLGEMIRAAGGDDSSGARRHYADLLARREFERVANGLKIPIEDARNLKP